MNVLSTRVAWFLVVTMSAALLTGWASTRVDPKAEADQGKQCVCTPLERMQAVELQARISSLEDQAKTRDRHIVMLTKILWNSSEPDDPERHTVLQFIIDADAKFNWDFGSKAMQHTSRVWVEQIRRDITESTKK